MKPIHFVFAALSLTTTFSAALATPGPLQNALEFVNTSVASGITPIAVFDLDETLLYTHERKLHSYQDALPVLVSHFPTEVNTARALTLADFPCAVEFVNSIRKAGAHIVFVSSRLHTLQFDATISSLDKLGFINQADESDEPKQC